MKQSKNEALVMPSEPEAATLHDIDTINDRLKFAQSRRWNLITPMTRITSLPVGCGVALSVIQVVPTINEYGNGPDVYRVDGGKLALSRHVLHQIGTALGVNWDARLSRRTDDGRTLYVWAYKAAGNYRNFDGQQVHIEGDYEWDVRDGSPRHDELIHDKKIDKARRAVLQARKFGLQRAQTGAQLRALATTGIKRAYEPEELERPFVVAKLHFDGHTDDPALKHVFAEQIARTFLGSGEILYGGSGGAPMLDAGDHVGEGDGAQCADRHTPEYKLARLPSRGTEEQGALIGEADDDALQRWARRIDDDLQDGIYDPDELDAWTELREQIDAELVERAGAKL